jgi:ABC-type Fe3+/spermidine/putrescine transport system ATPase subunit
MVRLAGLEDRYPNQLSGGQQQRVAVARALIFQPPVLLMDEPLGALDKKLRQQMQLEIKRIHDELGITFIYVTHDQEEALTMSDRIAIMNAGKIVQINAPREIYEKPANKFVAGFIGETNLLTGMVQRAVDGQRTILVSNELSIPIPADAAAEPGSNASIVVRPERVQITSVSKDSPSMRSEASAWLRGEVIECVYVGEQWRYKVRAGQLSVSAKTMCDGDTPALPIGSSVEVGWRVDDSQILEPGEH